MTTQRALTLGLAGLLLAGATACSSSDSSSGESSDGRPGAVKITVGNMPAKTNPAQRQDFLARVARFEAANPTIDLEPTESAWDARTFAAKLAGGTAETVFSVPFTEPGVLIRRKQAADLTRELAASGLTARMNPTVLKTVQDAQGHVFGVPYSALALGLFYHRDLFTKAGLDPDNPPRTWDEVRTAAKAISDRTGVPGFLELTTKNQGGWHLTGATYSYGGTVEKEDGGTYVASFTEGPTQRYLELLRDMRWQDNSMGTNQLVQNDDAMRAFAAGKAGMFTGLSEFTGPLITQFKMDKNAIGLAGLPQAGGNTTLLGGSVAVVSPRATKAQREAALKWIDFFYLKPLYDEQAAVETAKAAVKDGRPAGVPALSPFSTDVQRRVDAAARPYWNLPAQHFAPYAEALTTLQVRTEPPVAGQEVYAALDTAVQAVLTRRDADPGQELDKAAERVERILKSAQR